MTFSVCSFDHKFRLIATRWTPYTLFRLGHKTSIQYFNTFIFSTRKRLFAFQSREIRLPQRSSSAEIFGLKNTSLIIRINNLNLRILGILFRNNFNSFFSRTRIFQREFVNRSNARPFRSKFSFFFRSLPYRPAVINLENSFKLFSKQAALSVIKKKKPFNRTKTFKFYTYRIPSKLIHKLKGRISDLIRPNEIKTFRNS